MTDRWSRRRLLGLAVLAVAGLSSRAMAQPSAKAITVHKDPSCGCCGGWVEHVRRAGYAVSVIDTSDLETVKRRLWIPSDLWACHTAVLGEYVIEGHVPAHAVDRLLAERPAVAGIAVPGMPVGSPGMEGEPMDIYDVVGFASGSRVRFGRYRGARPV